MFSTVAINYKDHDQKEIIARAKICLEDTSILAINDFPPDPSALLDFSYNFGKPLLKYTKGETDVMDYVADIRLQPNISEDKRRPTQGNSEIKFHTAHSYIVVRPTYFALLMTDQGWLDQSKGNNGESLLIRWKDVIEEFKSRYPLTAEDDLQRLTTTSISYKPWYVEAEPANEPIMFYLPEGDIGVRYWEGISSTTEESVETINEGYIYLQALKRFDEVVNTCQKTIEYQMDKNQLIVIDNRRVAHARKPFTATKIDTQGNKKINPRQVFTIHVL